MRKGVIIAIALLVGACGTSKKSVHTERIEELEQTVDSLNRVSKQVEIVTDTVVKKETIIDKVETTVRVPIDCDSLGRVRGLNFSTGTGGASFSARIQDNELILDFKTDSIVNVLEQHYRDKYVKDSISLVQELTKITTKTVEVSDDVRIVRKDWKTIVFLLGLVLMVLVFAFRRKLKRLFRL